MAYLCGISLWHISVAYLCGISLWYISVVYLCGISLWYISVVYLCGISLWYISVVYLCGISRRDSVIYWNLWHKKNIEYIYHGIILCVMCFAEFVRLIETCVDGIVEGKIIPDEPEPEMPEDDSDSEPEVEPEPEPEMPEDDSDSEPEPEPEPEPEIPPMDEDFKRISDAFHRLRRVFDRDGFEDPIDLLAFREAEAVYQRLWYRDLMARTADW
jgi:hypothetical protein